MFYICWVKMANKAQVLVVYLVYLLALLLPCAALGVEEDRVKILSEGLKDKNESVRADSADALRDIGPEAAKAIPALVKALGDEKSVLVRRKIVEAIGAIGPKAQAAVPALMDALEDLDEDVRDWASLALSRTCDSECQVLIDSLSNKSMKLRRLGAIRAFGYMQEQASVLVPLIVKNVKDPDSEIRKTTIESLAMIRDERPIPILLETLAKDPDVDCRSAAAYFLGQFGSKAKAAVPILIEAMTLEGDSDSKLQKAAADSLMMIGPAAVTSLSAVLRDPRRSSWARREAAHVLGNIGEKALPSLAILVAVLKEKDEDLRHAAATALGMIGSEARAALHPLKVLAQCGTVSDRLVVASAMHRIDPDNPHSVRLLIGALKDENKSIRLSGVYALQCMDRYAKPAVPALGEALKDKDVSIRSAAAYALKLLEGYAREAVPALKEALKDEDPGVRKNAADALKAIDG